MLTARRPSDQHGAALAVSLVMLVILTLLGIAAMRSSRLSLRLSQNAESRITALENAQATADNISSNPTVNFPVASGLPYVNCFANPTSDVANHIPSASTAAGSWQSCLTTTLTLVDPSFRYAQVIRESPEFVSAAALRGLAGSGRAYDYARFSVIAGFDNSDSGMGAAEVAVGKMVQHVKPTGVTYQ